MKSLISKLSIFICLGIYTASFAWALTGHRIVAEIAEHHLSKNAKKEISKIFANQKMAYWANWPDFVKSDTTGVYKPMSAWHYVNISPQTTFADFVKNLQEQKAPNLYTQIPVLSAQLKDQKTSAADKKIALIYLIHMMGDLVQPMHTGRYEDLGGNKIKVTYFGKETNLHNVWDESLIENQKYSYTEYANLLDIQPESEVQQIQSGTLEDWLFDSHKIANKIYAQTPNGANLKYEYDYKFVPVLERQLLYGGLRLAKVLNDIYQ